MVSLGVRRKWPQLCPEDMITDQPEKQICASMSAKKLL
jgi:hypothetical protein